MVRKLLVGLTLAVFISSCFAGFSSGGRSGFSGGSRSFSSSRSYSMGRSGYSRPSTLTRAYVAPRTYSRPYVGSSSRTVINNHHYSSGGYGGGGFGHSMMGGLLGGYIGSSMFGNHGTTVIAGAAPAMIGNGQGAMMDGDYPVQTYGGTSGLGVAIFWMIVIVILVCALVFWVGRRSAHDSCHRNHW